MADFCDSLAALNRDITACCKCTRLVTHREEMGRVRRRAYREQEYWSRPVPGFGDPAARLLVMGLAPGAHGANRTGRVFTGDRSGEFLYRALWETGFANQAESISREDGLQLKDAYITGPVRCAPPDNKPTLSEISACRPYLVRELELLTRVRVVVALGGIGLNAYLSVLQARGQISSRASFSFGHGLRYLPVTGGPAVIACYHPSQQNTSTKRLTSQMLREIFVQARELIHAPDGQTTAQTDGALGGRLP